MINSAKIGFAAIATTAIFIVACSSEDDPLASQSADASAEPDSGVGSDAAPEGDTTPDAQVVPALLGSCTFTNPSSGLDECIAYTGSAWTADRAESHCDAPLQGVRGSFRDGQECNVPDVAGTCVLDGALGYETLFSGSQSEDCSASALQCVSFIGGEFKATELCEGTFAADAEYPLGVFIPPFDDCRAPLPGEEPGSREGGEICTHTLISACTEEGRNFADYASCDIVRTQRPYSPEDTSVDTDSEDPRFDDEAYMEELEWARDQVEACACVCCHSSELAPAGPSSFYVENTFWTDTVPDTGLAMLAGWVDSESFGAMDPSQNNGFDRTALGLPTNDVERMRAFLEGELARRGITRESVDEVAPFGGPIYTQSVYEPEPCPGNIGIRADGSMNWIGGVARYLYVLESDAAPPGVPPNRDMPDGTIWRFDVRPDQQAVPASEVRYGVTPPGAVQRYPLDGVAPDLVEGETYFFYALFDYGVPVTRCTFEYPVED